MSEIKIRHGNLYNDFEMGQVFRHHWGRTMVESDNILFSTMTLNFNPMYFNKDYAESLGHPDMVINPILVFKTVLGLSVEDLSEIGGPFLGVDECVFHGNVYPGDTIYAQSVVLDKKITESKPDYGIVTWHTKGRKQNGELVVEFLRRNLVSIKGMPGIK